MNSLLTPITANIGIFFDTETSGMVEWKKPSHMPYQPHMTQLAAVVMDIPQRRVMNSMNVIIKPDGWTIPDECVEINGITTEYANDVGIPERMALDMFLALWLGHTEDVGYKRYAFNTTFDNRIIRIGTKRYAKSLENVWHEGEYECQMMRARKVLGGKNPKLEDAYREICGKEIEDAHNAMSDVNALIDIFYAMNDAEHVDTDIFA